MNKPKKNYATIKVVNLKMFRENTLKYEVVSDKSIAINIAKPIFQNVAIERFCVIGLDNANTPTVIHINNGGISSCPVNPSTVFKILLLSNSAAFIIMHNHPSSTMIPSEQDWEITKRFKEVSKVLDIALLDHIIVNSDLTKSISLREFGRWSF